MLDHRPGLLRVAADKSGREEVELQQVAQRLYVASVQRQSSLDLLAEPPRQHQLLKNAGALGHDALNLSQLPVVSRHAPVQLDSLLGQLRR
ncbi:MAG: hypothetical protein ABSF25_04010 [Bryobacteraceae bacterium]